VELDGRRLRRLREDAGLDLTELARRASVSKAHLSMIETGKRGVSPAVATRLAQALGASVQALRPDA
jgi:transcriptional regulator with XRE-family HTH domain